jgi:atypical dual specificity phosphatase
MSLYAFSWAVEGELAGMACPDGRPEDFRELKARGVAALVNLTTRQWPPEPIERGGLEYLWLPIPDFAAPADEQIDRFVEFCDHNIAAGRPVVAHCIAGRGRTGTMIACYLAHRGMGPAEAIDYVRALRPGSIETAGQEEAVHAYAARCAAAEQA